MLTEAQREVLRRLAAGDVLVPCDVWERAREAGC
jgi:DNA-binding CsgD family transcriptional regulator